MTWTSGKVGCEDFSPFRVIGSMVSSRFDTHSPNAMGRC